MFFLIYLVLVKVVVFVMVKGIFNKFVKVWVNNVFL